MQISREYEINPNQQESIGGIVDDPNPQFTSMHQDQVSTNNISNLVSIETNSSETAPAHISRDKEADTARRLKELEDLMLFIPNQYYGNGHNLEEIAADAATSEMYIKGAQYIANNFPASKAKDPVYLPRLRASQMSPDQRAQYYRNTAESMAEAACVLRAKSNTDTATFPLKAPQIQGNSFEMHIPLTTLEPDGFTIGLKAKAQNDLNNFSDIGHINLQITKQETGENLVELGNVQSPGTMKHGKDKKRKGAHALRNLMNPSNDNKMAKRQLEFVLLFANALETLVEHEIITPETMVTRKRADELFNGEFSVNSPLYTTLDHIRGQVTSRILETGVPPENLIPTLCDECGINEMTARKEALRQYNKYMGKMNITDEHKKRILDDITLQLAVSKSPEFYKKFRNYPDSPHDPFIEVAPGQEPVPARAITDYTKSRLLAHESAQIMQSKADPDQKLKKLEELKKKICR